MQNINRELIRELVELRQMSAQRQCFQDTNNYYIQQLSQVQIELNEAKQELASKEKELGQLRGLYSDSSVTDELIFTGRFMDEDFLQERINQLEAENSSLRNLTNLKNEVDRLRLQLEHTNSLKAAYMEKYEEIQMKLLLVDQEDSILYDDDETIDNLNKKVEILQKANSDIYREIENLSKQADKANHEIKQAENDLIHLPKTIMELEQEILQLQKAPILPTAASSTTQTSFEQESELPARKVGKLRKSTPTFSESKPQQVPLAKSTSALTIPKNITPKVKGKKARQNSGSKPYVPSIMRFKAGTSPGRQTVSSLSSWGKIPNMFTTNNFY